MAGSVYWILSTAFPPTETFVDKTIYGDDDVVREGSTGSVAGSVALEAYEKGEEEYPKA